jgi:hypothetical protein
MGSERLFFISHFSLNLGSDNAQNPISGVIYAHFVPHGRVVALFVIRCSPDTVALPGGRNNSLADP